LFFIEAGVLKVEHSTGHTATRGSLGSVKGFGSLNGGTKLGDTLRAIKERSVENSLATGAQTFRLARIGVGWVAGTMEFFHTRRPGNVVAVDHCRLHHIPFSKIQEVEHKEPGLALSLYKLLSYLMARRQEATIGQLATLHAIMSSPPRWKSLKKHSSKVVH
jgi:CRP-like cAMP-binding protein